MTAFASPVVDHGGIVLSWWGQANPLCLFPFASQLVFSAAHIEIDLRCLFTVAVPVPPVHPQQRLCPGAWSSCEDWCFWRSAWALQPPEQQAYFWKGAEYIVKITDACALVPSLFLPVHPQSPQTKAAWYSYMCFSQSITELLVTGNEQLGQNKTNAHIRIW